MHQLANTFFLIYFIYHILVGIPGILSVQVTRRLAYKLYKLKLEENLDLKYQYALKALGFYALFTAFVCFIGFQTEHNDVKSALLCAIGFLTLIRGLGRFFGKDLITRAFNLPSNRNVFHVLLNGLMAGGMFYVAYQLV